MRRIRCKGGFTLIELLVVIAIIALLAAILFPIFATARENARASFCSSNMRQITMAALQYADDNNGKLVALNAFSSNPWAINWTSWDEWRGAALYPYINRSKVLLRCPSDFRRSPAAGGEHNYSHSYTINAWVTWRVGHPPEYPSKGDANDVARAACDGFPIGWFKRPSKTIFLVDENTDFRYPYVRINDALFVFIDHVTDRHNGRGNVAYLDGHMGTLYGMPEWNTARWPDGTLIFHDNNF